MKVAAQKLVDTMRQGKKKVHDRQEPCIAVCVCGEKILQKPVKPAKEKDYKPSSAVRNKEGLVKEVPLSEAHGNTPTLPSIQN